mmetsp:Transcript_30504/g.71484  ORF Transcript_30504/g.71484 Transcript_30504/m.71484 type:complete len:762 (-) Transcript_30504:176-2461(-)
MASVASSSSGYGPFDSDGPDRNGPLHADPIADEFGTDLREGGELDTSLPIELAESMAALNAFGSFDGNEEQQPSRRAAKATASASGGGEALGNGHCYNGKTSEEINSNGHQGQEEGSSIHDFGDETSDASPNVDYSLDAGDQDLTPEQLSRLPNSFTPSPPSREKEPTAVARTENDDAYTTTDDDNTEEGGMPSSGDRRYSEDDSVDQQVKEDALEGVDESLAEHIGENSTVDSLHVDASMLEEEEEEDCRDIVRADTDLSGISDPITDLNERNHQEKTLPVSSGIGALAESVDSSGHNDDFDDGATAEQNQINHDDESPSTPPSTVLPAKADTTVHMPRPSEDAEQAAAISGNVKNHVMKKSISSEPEGDEKERPSSWLSKLLVDESLISVNIDAERIVMAEDTDLKPSVQEPELDGEPAFVYEKKRRTAKVADADAADAAGAAASKPELVPPVNSSAGSGAAASLHSALTLPKIPPAGGGDESNTLSVDPPGKPPLPSAGPERAPPKRNSAPQEPVAGEAPALNSKRRAEKSVLTGSNISSKGESEINAKTTESLLRGWSEPSQTESQSSVGELDDIPSDASPLPDAKPILARGNIFTRSSLRSLVMKKWHSSFWARYGPTSLLVFRSKDDFDDWLNNPYHSQRQREYLVKAKLDFFGEMIKADVRGFKMTDIKLKSYEKKGRPMHNFKLEKWTNLGVSLVAAFASPDLAEVEEVRSAVSQSLEMCPWHGLRSIDDLLVKTPSDKALELRGKSKGSKDP